MERTITSLVALMFGVSLAPQALAQKKPEVAVCVSVTLHTPPKPVKEEPPSVPETPAEKPSETSSPSSSSAATPEGAAPKPTSTPAPAQPAASAPPPSLFGPVADEPAAPFTKAATASARPRNMDDSDVSADAAADLASAVDPENRRDPRVSSGAHLPLGQTPTVYLKRLMDHFITHEPGFVANGSCTEHVEVELYPLKVGWTAFARYSGTGREERVDQLLPTELSQFAERSVLALLHDVPISSTVSRDNVLWADSLKSTQRIRGNGHFAMGVGTRLRAGEFATLDADREGTSDEVSRKYRLFTPIALSLGYRGQFEEYGFEATGELDVGTSVTGVRHNPSGGNIDYGGSFGVALHVLRYTQPRALTSPYFGAGATFALHWFQATRAQPERTTESRSRLYGGGLDVDVVGGYEFMRASAISFYLQGELTLPAYIVRTENNDGRINTWFPGAALRLGANFF
ncbi:MAG TPA: hypothetical protein VFQ61_35670 [Polyangiaceae bacterium]|nr:hypothetical protein [Polyangiaceae bacterium]